MADYALALRFTVTIDNVGTLGTWSKCDGLTVEYEIQEYQEGGLNEYAHRLPGRCKYQNIKLTRPLDKSSKDIANWVAGMRNQVKRSNGEIAVLDASGEVVAQWNLKDMYPVKWSGPSLDATGNQLANETLELAHNGFLKDGG